MKAISTAQHLLTKLETESAKHGVTAIRRVYISMGPLCRVEPDDLVSAFQTVAAGTVASNAQLKIHYGPVKSRCQRCGIHVSLDSKANPTMHCARCGAVIGHLTPDQEIAIVLIRAQSSYCSPFHQLKEVIVNQGFSMGEKMSTGPCLKTDSA